MSKVNLDSSSRVDIICRKGDTFELTVDFGQSMSTYIESGLFKMEVRTSDDQNAGDAVVSMDMAALAQNPSGVANSLLVISKSATIMASVSAGTYVYDLQSVKNQNTTPVIKTWMKGFFTVNEDISI
jgi:hypothetical protein